jgi:hypothetical protein
MWDRVVSLALKGRAILGWALAVVLVVPIGLAFWVLGLAYGTRLSRTQPSRRPLRPVSAESGALPATVTEKAA